MFYIYYCIKHQMRLVFLLFLSLSVSAQKVALAQTTRALALAAFLHNVVIDGEGCSYEMG